METLRRPEFTLPISLVKPGMELSRNIVLRGATLLRYGTILDDELIDRLRSLGVGIVQVHLSERDFQAYKDILLSQDTPPAYDTALRAVRESFIQNIPPGARPVACGANDEIIERVEEIVQHSLDILLGSRQLFALVREADFFLTPLLRHSLCAWIYSLCVGVSLNYNLPSLIDLSISSLFYDIGMTRVPAKILNKPGKLTDQEYAEVKKHTYHGRNILESAERFSSRAKVVAFEHHENYYGGGYPRNKRGDTIHEFSQIVSITDKFAALTTERAQRERKDPADAVEILMAYTKTAVSPKIFIAFLRSVLFYPRGSLLKLNTGEIGTPVEYPTHKPYRPVLRILFDRNGGEVLHGKRTVDLSANPGISVMSYSVPEEVPYQPPR